MPHEAAAALPFMLSDLVRHIPPGKVAEGNCVRREEEEVSLPRAGRESVSATDGLVDTPQTGNAFSAFSHGARRPALPVKLSGRADDVCLALCYILGERRDISGENSMETKKAVPDAAPQKLNQTATSPRRVLFVPTNLMQVAQVLKASR